MNEVRARSRWRTFYIGIVAVLPAAALVAYPIGLTVGYSVQETSSICALNSNVIQPPLFMPYDRDSPQWWYNMIEEAAFANASFVALNFRGDSPCGHYPPVGNEPTSFAGTLVSALNQRGYSPILKVALFDDTGAYPNAYSDCNGGVPTFDLSNQALWQSYWWNVKWKPFFTNVPAANRMMVAGKPLVFLWSIASGLGFTNASGHLGPLIDFLRAQYRTTFGGELFIDVDYSWIQADATVGAKVDGVNKWFTPPTGTSWTSYTHSGLSGAFTTGVVNPGFWENQTGYQTPRNNGLTLSNGLTNTGNANLVLVEGLTDIEENAGLYRGSSTCDPTCPGGATRPADCWGPNPPSDANLYLNVFRQTAAPFPKYVVYEAEACDNYSTFNTGASTLYRRSSTLDIAYTDTTQSDWSVRLKNVDWLEFGNFQLGASSHYLLGIRYASASGGAGALVIDGVVVESFNLVATGGLDNFAVYTPTQPFSISNGAHNVQFQMVSGDIRLDYWILNGLSPGGLVTVTPCRILDTRNAAGPYGGPALAASATRSFVAVGTCGIPSTALAIATNVTVTGSTSAGYFALFQSNIVNPGTWTLNYSTGQTRANNAIISLDSGAFSVFDGQLTGSAHCIVDVTGYFQ